MLHGRNALGNIIPDSIYRAWANASAEENKAWKGLLPAEVRAQVSKFGRGKGQTLRSATAINKRIDEAEESYEERYQLAKDNFCNLGNKLVKAGVTSSLGFNFFDLRGPEYLLYPVNTPMRNQIPRVGKVNDGYGTAAHWQGTRNFGTVYFGVAEGQRNEAGTPDNNDYIATYKEGGQEGAVTFTAQFAGEGYTDNLADERLRRLHALWLAEEAMIWLGNSGTATGNNGVVLGAGPTPTAALVTGTGIVTATNVSACIVPLSAMGVPQNTQYGYGNPLPSVANGLTGQYTRTNADNSQLPINCGNGSVGAFSNVVVTTGSTLQVKFTWLPQPGAFFFAIYVNVTDASAPTKANAFLATVQSNQVGNGTTCQYTYAGSTLGAQNANAAAVNTDYSYNPYDFDGLLTWNLNNQTGATGTGAYYLDLAGGTLTSQHNGGVAQIETILNYIFTQFQTTPTAIWGSPDAVVALTDTILASGTTPTNFRLNYDLNEVGQLVGGQAVVAYHSKLSMQRAGGQSIPIRPHVMLPPGTLYFAIDENPYPTSRAPYSRAMLVQRDYYGIEWPLVTRQWTFGTYVHEVLALDFPWIPAILTGISATPGT